MNFFSNILKKLSLKGRVRFILGSITAVILSGGAAVFMMMSYITSGYQSTINHYKKMETDFLTVRIQMLEMTRTEKDFLSSKDEIYADLMEESFDAFDEAYNSMVAIEQTAVTSDVLSSIKASIEKYKSSFKDLTQLTISDQEKRSSLHDLSKEAVKRRSVLLKAGKNSPKFLLEASRLSELRAYSSQFLSSNDSSLINNMQTLDKALKGTNSSALSGKFLTSSKSMSEGFSNISSKTDSLQLHLMKAEENILKSIELLNAATNAKVLSMAKTANIINIGITLGVLLVVLITLGALVLFSNLSKSMADISNKIRSSSQDTFVSSEKLKGASDRVSKAAGEQASAIQETVATLNEIAAMVNKSVDNANSSTEKANLSHEIASEGREAVNNMRQSMKAIETSINHMSVQVEESNEQIENIVKIIGEISNKTAIINDIVFQTKLLSFNASVEAARAGDHGKGFAVVAEEVGNLAQMSGNAAKEISELLGNSKDKVQEIVRHSKEEMGKLVHEGSDKVSVGVDIADRCDEILGEVVEHVSNVKELMVEISHASKEQAEGVNNISIAMNELDEATHSNSDMAHETSSCSHELANQATSLARAVELLDSEVFGLNGQANNEGNDTSEGGSSENVHQLNPETEDDEANNMSQAPTKKAVGFDSSVPTSNDPGFEE